MAQGTGPSVGRLGRLLPLRPPGAGAVDHVISRKLRPDLALDPANLRPRPWQPEPLPWCKQACNEVKGDRAGLPTRQQPRQSRRW
jgi:hypothetical protein